MIHRLALLLFTLGALGCATPAQVEPRHPPASLLSEARWKVPGPVRADVRGFRPECAALIPYTVQPPIVKPRAVEMVRPKLDHLARRICVKGAVILEAVVDESGRVCDARLLKGFAPMLPPERFDEPIREALLSSRFEPATFGDIPVAAVFLYTVRLDI